MNSFCIEIVAENNLEGLFAYISELDSISGVSYLAGDKNHAHGRYQYLAWNPAMTIEAKGAAVRVIEKETREYKGNSIDIVEKLWKERITKFHECFDSTKETYDLPFIGGAIGYFSYDLKNSLENLNNRALDDLHLHDILLRFYDCFFIKDQDTNTTYLVSYNKAERDAVKKIMTAHVVSQEKKIPLKIAPQDHATITSSLSKENYFDAFYKVQKAIIEGRVYILNLAQRLSLPCNNNLSHIFLQLIDSYPAPYAAYIQHSEYEVCCISPERFMSVCDGIIETCPIKGTSKRGKNTEEDTVLKNILLQSKKEEAELSMVVDLERNDLGRICEYGSVKVLSHRKAIPYPTVWQIVSTIQGKLQNEMGLFDIIRATFPGGSVTGTPKIEAMSIIEKIEPVKRGLYTGSIGWLDFRGNMDLSIVIRSIIKKNNQAYVYVGGGIVADSEVEKEYEETWLKAQALLEFL